MAISAFEIRRYEKLLAEFIDRHRPPAHLRQELDLSSRITGQSVEISETRRAFDDPARKIENPVAQTAFIKSRKHWKIFWQRADLKWHSYTPVPVVPTLEAFLAVVDEDAYACFFG